MIKSIKNYISSFVDISDMDSYNMECSTSVVVSTPGSAWREEKDGFYIVPEELVESERVINYRYSFDKYCGSYKTSDSIVVRCSPTGDILDIIYRDYGVNWSDFYINEDKLNNMVDAYLTNAIAEEYKIKDYSLDEKLLVYRDNQIKLSLTYELTLMKDGTEFVILCPMMVSA